MTDRQSLKDLERRLAEAKGPNFELERLIAEVVDRESALYRPPNYTASLDAAVSLVERVLPGCTVDLTIGALSDAQVMDADAAIHGNAEDAPTPALALCLACVRALIAQGEK